MSKFVTYQKLEKIVQESQVGVRVKVQSNPYGAGGEQMLTFIIDGDGNISSYCNSQGDIDGVDYTYNYHWENDYKGTFELVDEAPVKPEVYNLGDWVVVTDQINKANYHYIENYIGQIWKIDSVKDDYEGISYRLIQLKVNDCTMLTIPHCTNSYIFQTYDRN